LDVRDRLHRLIDQLPEGEVRTAERFLEYLRDLGGDPLLARLSSAAEDDETTTEEDAAAADEGWREYVRGDAREWDAVRDEVGRG
jgi:hypothetical protein